MILVIQIFAFLLALGVVGVLLLIGGESLISAYSNYVNKKQYQLKKLGRFELAREIGLYHYWMSETPEVQRALKKLSKHIIQNYDCNFNAEKYRDYLNEKD